jgi:uncharacterized phage-like protein YoqJ
MILGFTGHRPNSLPGKYSERTYQALLDTANFVLTQYRPTAVISGFAIGWDTAIAECAIKQNIALIAAIPCQSQSCQWPKSSQIKYWQLLDKASYVNIISSSYSPQAMQLRNQYIVDRCHQLMALWHQGSSGTAHCVNYALRMNRLTFNCWDTFLYFYYHY